MLYQAELADLTAEATLSVHWGANPEADGGVREFAERLVRDVLGSLPEIDALLTSVSHHWALDRMSTVDRNILRLAVGEMRSDPETPPAVVIDEAVELARSYGDRESQAFVNGLLEGVRKRLARSSGASGAADARPGSPP